MSREQVCTRGFHARFPQGLAASLMSHPRQIEFLRKPVPCLLRLNCQAALKDGKHLQLCCSSGVAGAFGCNAKCAEHPWTRLCLVTITSRTVTWSECYRFPIQIFEGLLSKRDKRNAEGRRVWHQGSQKRSSEGESQSELQCYTTLPHIIHRSSDYFFAGNFTV